MFIYIISGCQSLVCGHVVGLLGHRIVSSLGDANIPATLDSGSASVRCSFNLKGFPILSNGEQGGRM